MSNLKLVFNCFSTNSGNLEKSFPNILPFPSVSTHSVLSLNVIQSFLKKYASLQKKVVIAGLYNRVEIWDEKKWDLYKQKIEKEAGGIAERLKELGV